MTDRYENIRKALEMGPTPNEWYWTDEYTARDGSKTWSLIGDRGVGILSCDGKENSPKSADATYIAACDPDTIRALLAERDALRDAIEQRDIAIDMLARWCVAVSENGAGWDDWDEHYKDAAYRPGPLRSLLDAAIHLISKESK